MYIRKDQTFVWIHIFLYIIHKKQPVRFHSQKVTRNTVSKKLVIQPIQLSSSCGRMKWWPGLGPGIEAAFCAVDIRYNIYLYSYTLPFGLRYFGHFGTRHRIQFPKMVHCLSRGDSGCLENDKEGCASKWRGATEPNGRHLILLSLPIPLPAPLPPHVHCPPRLTMNSPKTGQTFCSN